MNQFLIILVVSLLLAWLSRRSLRAPGSHGFYRFFAWEAIALLIILNIPHWFDNPFSPFQIVSWSLLVLSVCLAAGGFARLRSAGGAERALPGDPNFGFENTTRLVTGGVYSRIRHPLYSSLLFLAWGAFLKHPSAEGLLAAVFASVFLCFTARIEEGENLKKFGAAYAAYMRTSGMFLPGARGTGRHGVT
jgi:protein-S-isoprenylcysteine O-methyltransferase Ste14